MKIQNRVPKHIWGVPADFRNFKKSGKLRNTQFSFSVCFIKGENLQLVSFIAQIWDTFRIWNLAWRCKIRYIIGWSPASKITNFSEMLEFRWDAPNMHRKLCFHTYNAHHRYWIQKYLIAVVIGFWTKSFFQKLTVNINWPILEKFLDHMNPPD